METIRPADAGELILSTLRDVILSRHSERTFSPGPLDPGEVRAIIENALHAPSPSGKNPFYFVLLEDREIIGRLVTELEKGFDSLLSQPGADPGRLKILRYYRDHSLFIRDASVLLLCFTNDRESALDQIGSSGNHVANLLSLGAVLQNMGLLCAASGIGHCILSAAVELLPGAFERLFPAPGHLHLRCVFAMGEPAGQTARPQKVISVDRYLRVVNQ